MCVHEFLYDVYNRHMYDVIRSYVDEESPFLEPLCQQKQPVICWMDVGDPEFRNFPGQVWALNVARV